MSDSNLENTRIQTHGLSPENATRDPRSNSDQNTNISDDLVVVDWHDWREGISHKEAWIVQVHPVPWSGLIFLVLAIFFLGSGPLGVVLGLSRVAIFAISVVVLLWPLHLFLRRNRAWKLSPKEMVLHGESGRRVRLIASGAMLERVGLPQLDPFEPRLFRVYGAVRGEKWARRSIALGSALATLGVFAIARGVGRVPWTGWVGGMPWFFDIQVAIFMSFAPTFVLWPTYYRVVPGRVDIMKYGMLGPGAPDVEKLDLRACRVSADAGSGAVRIELADGTRKYLQFQGTTASRMEFAKVVAEAAISPHPTPPLPDDALVG